MKRVVLQSLAACGGSFVAASTTPRGRKPSAYDDPSMTSGPVAPVVVTFEKGKTRTPIAGVAELWSTLRAHGCAPETEIHDAGAWARLIAHLLDLDRVVEDPELWDFLDEKYGIPAADHLPLLGDGALHFTVAKMALGAKPQLQRIRVDLETGEVERTAV